MTDMTRHVLTLTCRDRPGIVHAVAGGLLERDANIIESAQYDDLESGLFFMRVAFDSPVADAEVIRTSVAERIEGVDATVRVVPVAQRVRVLILVSHLDHCLLELLYRWRIGDLPVDIVGIVSNHETCQPIAEQYGVDFHHVPVTAETKAIAESRLLELAKTNRVDLVVLARYMQILTDQTCAELVGSAINIHHSFLPGFKGASPYRQAHERGVKLIGATAHYVTADLDEGPIIEQDVVRVRHGDSPLELTAIGRDVERRVLVRAVRAHAEHRVFLNGKRTVIFD
jgi:formyltetrahydrofolate deformylase